MAGGRDISKIFTEAGGNFVLRPDALNVRFSSVRAILFDWDGVFNDGYKSHQAVSGFSEIDSMAINLVRYHFFLKTGRLPFSGIITGQLNQGAIEFAKRENFHCIYLKIKNKHEAMEHFRSSYRLQHRELAWFFDDVIDFSTARECGVRVMIGNKAAPLTSFYASERGLADYITANNGGNGGIREALEMLMALNGNFDEVLNNRVSFSANYREYFGQRGEIHPVLFTQTQDGIREMED